MGLTNKRILVTGAFGFLGRQILHSLEDTGHVVIRCGHTHKKISSDVICDIGNSYELLTLLDDVKPDCIINLGAKINFNESEADSLFAINSLAPALMADYCKNNNAHLVQASSCSVHGFKQHIFDQNTAFDPDTAYGKSKLLADEFIIASNCRSSIIRFGGIFGSGGPPHLGINKAIINAANGIPPELNGDGSCKRNYIFVDDAALAMAFIIEHELSGIFYAAGEVLQLSKMLEQICETWMPDKNVLRNPGAKLHDQISVPSHNLPTTRKFRDCLDICKTRLA